MSSFASCLLAVLCLSIPAVSPAQELIQTGRYTAVAAFPTDAQRAPLRAIVTVTFPEDVTTVGAAVQHVLSGTGYALADVLYWDAEVFGLFERPLPDVQRTLGPVETVRALKTLVGPTFRVLIDPVHRLIAFELDPRARALGFDPDAQTTEF